MIYRVAAFCLIMISGCCSQTMLAQNPSPSPTPTQSLEQRVSDLEKRLQAIESIPAVATMLKLKSSLQADATPAPTPTPQTDAPLELVSWRYQYKAGRYEYQNRQFF
jgi:hypothetical protein